MENYTKIIRDYPNISFRYTRGKIDIFLDKQFHPHYEIYLLINSSVEFINDHTRRNIKPHNLIIIPPGEYHHFIVEEQCISEYERCVLNIYPEFLGGNILEETLSGKEVLILSPNDRIVENFIYLKDSMTENSEEDFKYILSAIATDIVFLIKQYSNSTQKNAQGFLHPVCSQIMNYINANYKSNITLNDIAEYVLLSASSVSHKFKEDFGISIKKYITEKRMNEIHICLQNGQKPQELSEEFGFSNYSTFYRSYYKHFGIPPSQSKRKI